MPFYLILLILTLALFSPPCPLATGTELSSHNNSGEIEWAAESISLVGASIDVVFSDDTVQSLSDAWDLPPGLLFCNRTTDTTITHTYVSDLMNSAYADKANSDLLRAQSGEHWKMVHKIGTLRGTQICKFCFFFVEVRDRSYFARSCTASLTVETFAILESTTSPSAWPNTA